MAVDDDESGIELEVDTKNEHLFKSILDDNKSMAEIKEFFDELKGSKSEKKSVSLYLVVAEYEQFVKNMESQIGKMDDKRKLASRGVNILIRRFNRMFAAAKKTGKT